MQNKIPLNTERMAGRGPENIDDFQVNYLFGLNELCQQCIKQDFTILELGCNNGVSSTLFAYFANQVICVDYNRTGRMNDVLEKYKNITFYQMSFEDFFKKDGDKKYDLVYIDGNHDFQSVYRDIELFKDKIKNEGYLSGHDYNSTTPGVKLAIDKHFPNQDITIFSDSSWLMKKNWHQNDMIGSL